MVFDILKLMNIFSQFEKLWGCSSVDKGLGWGVEDPGSIPNQGEFLSLKFLLKRK